MTEKLQPATLAEHLGHLEADLDDVVAMLTVHHNDAGDIQPATLAKAETLKTSLGRVIHALTHHEHLAMDADDVWAALTLKHKEHDSGIA